jgi:plasmid stability protein
MAQFIVRNLEENLKQQLKQRASRHGVSMEEEIRQILRNAIAANEMPDRGLGTRINARFSKIGITEDLPELRGSEIKSINFEE